MTELLPCPFCGGVGVEFVSFRPAAGGITIAASCDKCGIQRHVKQGRRWANEGE